MQEQEPGGAEFHWIANHSELAYILAMPRVGNPKNRKPHFVRAWREHRGLTQEQLADKLKTTKANISRIENLRQGYTQDFLEAAAVILKTEPWILIKMGPETRK